MTTFRGPALASDPDARSETLGGFLADVATRFDRREAIVFHGDGGRTSWTYGDLFREARRVAAGLIAAGVHPGERIGLLMGNRPEWVASAFGVALAGGILVPVNTYLEAPELAYVLGHSSSSFLLMQGSLRGHDYAGTMHALRADGSALPALRGTVTLTDDWESFLRRGDAAEAADLDARGAAVSPGDDAILIYTSGTTATPKGVLHTHAPAALQCRRFVRHLALDRDVRAWSAFPFFWTAGFAMVMGATLAAGGCLVLQEAFEPGEALGLLEAERVTIPHAWPHQLAELEEHADWSRTDLSAVRYVESFTAFGRHPRVRVEPYSWSPRAAFGLTETFTIITSTPSDSPPAIRDRAQGKILPGNALRIVNPATGSPNPAGADGEIAVSGATLMKCYVGVPRAQTLDRDGFFHTGDAGSVDSDGYLHWTGRTSDLIKTGGANVSPVEIEMELLHHPALKAAGAVGVPHPTLGQIVVVVAVPQEGTRVNETDVRGFLRGRIASYKIPRRVVFVREDELTLTGNQKIRPEDLRTLAAARLGSLASEDTAQS